LSAKILSNICKLWIVYIGNVILAKTLATATKYVLALATLGDATKNRNNPFLCPTAQDSQGKYCFMSLLLALSGILRQWKQKQSF
jgi:hypothetical protein